MEIDIFTVGLYLTNCYVVCCGKTGETVVVDPGFSGAEAKPVLEKVEGKTLRYVVNTHGHPDHTQGNKMLKEGCGAPILIHEGDAHMLETYASQAGAFGLQVDPVKPDRLLGDGDVIKFGKSALEVHHTPGHSPGSICLVGEDVVFTGDTLFAGSIGRTDLPGGSYEQILASLHQRLMALPDHFNVYPGHGPISTIGKERRINPFLSRRYGLL